MKISNLFGVNQFRNRNNNAQRAFSFTGAAVDYCYQIKKIERSFSRSGVKADLLYSGDEKNFCIATCLRNAFNLIIKSKLKIPKFALSLNDYEDLPTRTAAVTDYCKSGKNHDLTIILNTPLYKYMSNDSSCYRLKSAPKDTSVVSDFFHEFAHAYQVFFNFDVFEKIKKEHFNEPMSSEIRKEIGNYAVTNKSEFIAEFFRVVFSGKKIKSAKLIDEYKSSFGPSC